MHGIEREGDPLDDDLEDSTSPPTRSLLPSEVDDGRWEISSDEESN